MKRFFLLSNTFFTLSIVMFFLSCSTAPKKSMAVTNTTQKAYNFYENANSSLSQGDLNTAQNYLDKAYNLAISVDNTELICKILLSAITKQINSETTDSLSSSSAEKNNLLTTNRSIDSLMEEVKTTSQYANDKNTLQAIIKIFEIRIKLYNAKLEKQSNSENAQSDFNNSKIQKELDLQIKPLEKQPYYLAYLYRTKGECSSFTNDEKNASVFFEKAAEIHTKNRYLYDIGYDWYLAAQSYSKSGNKQKAISAIQNAIKYDKDAENSDAIVQDFMAVSFILLKGSPTENEKQTAEFYKQKAQKIQKAQR